MGWAIGRTMIMEQPGKARAKALDKLFGLPMLEDAEAVVVPVLIEAMLMVESYRGARHPFTQLPELTAAVDAMLRELHLTETAEAMAAE